MPSRNHLQAAFLIVRRKAAASRTLPALFAGFGLLLGFLWAKDSFSLALRAFLFLFPYLFLFLSQDMFRDEIDSGALENVIFVNGGFREYLFSKLLYCRSSGWPQAQRCFRCLPPRHRLRTRADRSRTPCPVPRRRVGRLLLPCGRRLPELLFQGRLECPDRHHRSGLPGDRFLSLDDLAPGLGRGRPVERPFRPGAQAPVPRPHAPFPERGHRPAASFLDRRAGFAALGAICLARKRIRKLEIFQT